MVNIVIREQDAKMMLYELLRYNEKLLLESNFLARKPVLHQGEVKRYQYLGREINRSARAAIDMQKEIERTWGLDDLNHF